MNSDSVKTVRDFVTLVRGTTYKGELVGKPGPALLGLGSIQPGGGFREADFKTYGGECPDKLMLTPGDLFASLKGATKDGKMIGSVARVPSSVKSGRLTQDTVKLEFIQANKEVENYLYWLLRTPQYREYCAGRAMGSAVVAMSREDFLSYEVPPLSSFRSRTVELLEEIEKRERLLRETNATLEAIAQALFKSWFIDFDPVHARARGEQPAGLAPEVAALFPDSFEESELGMVPRGWKVVSVGDVAEVVKGKSYSSKDLVDSHDTALVTLKSFERGGGFRLDGFKPYSGAYKPSQVVVPGDLIIAYTDVTQAAELIGKPAIVVGVENHQTLVASLDVGIVRPVEDNVSRQFLYGLFRTEPFQSHTFAHTSGTTVLHLAKDGVGSFEFACPPVELVKVFTEIADSLAERRQTNIDQMRTLATLRDTLLPRLISGQLRLPDAEQQLKDLAV